MSSINVIFLALMALLLNACSDLDNSIPPAELTEYEQKLQLKSNWSHSLGGGIDAYHKIEPVVVGDHIYTLSSNGLVSKIKIITGAIVWQKNLQQKTYAGLAASKDFIAIVNSDGILSVYDNNADLDLIWKKHLKSEVNVQPVIDGDDLFVRLSNGQLNSYQIHTGEKSWSVSRRVPELSLTGSSKPSVFSDLVFSGFDNGRLVAFERENGESVWEKIISIPSGRSELDRMVDLDGNFIIKNGVIYVSAFQGRLEALQTQNGSELWSRSLSSVKQLSADDEAIYVSDQDSTLWAIDRRSGAALWKQDELHHRRVTSMTIVNDSIVVADFEGYAHWLDKQTGKLKARLQVTANKIINPPIYIQQQVLFLDTSNHLSSVSVVKK